MNGTLRVDVRAHHNLRLAAEFQGALLAVALEGAGKIKAVTS